MTVYDIDGHMVPAKAMPRIRRLMQMAARKEKQAIDEEQRAKAVLRRHGVLATTVITARSTALRRGARALWACIDEIIESYPEGVVPDETWSG